MSHLSKSCLAPYWTTKQTLANSLVHFGCVYHQTPKSKLNEPRVYFPYNMIHIISSCDNIGSWILTSLALHRCFGPSAPSHHSTCPSHLQLVRRAKSCLDLLYLDLMTQCHVSCAMSSFITCVTFATFPCHLHHHGMCCSHICTCGPITYVSHIKHNQST